MRRLITVALIAINVAGLALIYRARPPISPKFTPIPQITMVSDTAGDYCWFDVDRDAAMCKLAKPYAPGEITMVEMGDVPDGEDRIVVFHITRYEEGTIVCPGAKCPMTPTTPQQELCVGDGSCTVTVPESGTTSTFTTGSWGVGTTVGGVGTWTGTCGNVVIDGGKAPKEFQ